MDPKIITFSSDSIRGNIIYKSLIWHNIQSKWHSKLYETEAAIIRHKPVLLIVDMVDCFTKALLFLKTLTQNQPALRIVKLIESHKRDAFDRHGVSKNDCYTEPFEPEILISEIIEIFDSINSMGVNQTINSSAPVAPAPKNDNVMPTKNNPPMFEPSLPPFFHEVEMNWFQRFLAQVKNSLGIY